MFSFEFCVRILVVKLIRFYLQKAFVNLFYTFSVNAFRPVRLFVGGNDQYRKFILLEIHDLSGSRNLFKRIILRWECYLDLFKNFCVFIFLLQTVNDRLTKLVIMYAPLIIQLYLREKINPNNFLDKLLIFQIFTSFKHLTQLQ